MKIVIPKIDGHFAYTLTTSYGAGGVTTRNILPSSLYHKGAVLTIQRHEQSNQRSQGPDISHNQGWLFQNGGGKCHATRRWFSSLLHPKDNKT